MADSDVSQPWWKKSFHALVDSRRLPIGGSLKACGAVSAMAVIGGIAGAAGGRGDSGLAIAQGACGAAALAGTGVAWWRPGFRAPYFVAMGLAILVSVALYSRFMIDALASRQRFETTRFAHTPGVLALGLAFSFRLLWDFVGPDSPRERWAARIGMAGLVVGGILDVVITWSVMSPR